MKIFLCFAALACFAALVAGDGETGDGGTTKEGKPCFKETDKKFEEFEKEMETCMKKEAGNDVAEVKCLLMAQKRVDDKGNVRVEDMIKKVPETAYRKYVKPIRKVYKECEKEGIQVDIYAACLVKTFGKEMKCDDFDEVEEEVKEEEAEKNQKEA